MTWDTLEWRPLDPAELEGVAALGDVAAMLQSAVEEAVSAHVLGPVTIAEATFAIAPAGTVPPGFAGFGTLELLGTPRRLLQVAFMPDTGDQLNGTPIEAAPLAEIIVEAVEMVLTEILGDGLSRGPVGTSTLDAGSGPLLLRLALRDAGGNGVDLVAAMDAALPAEFTTHVVALQAMGPATPSKKSASPAAAPEPAAPEPAAPAAVAPEPAPASQAPAAPATANGSNGAAAVAPFALNELTPTPPPATNGGGRSLDLLLGVQLEVTVEIGRTRLSIRDVLALGPGSIVELDKLAGEKVDVFVNGRQVASGEVVVVDDNFGVRITDVASPERRILSTGRG